MKRHIKAAAINISTIHQEQEQKMQQSNRRLDAVNRDIYRLNLVKSAIFQK